MKRFLITSLLAGILTLPLLHAEEKGKREETPVEKAITRGIAYLLTQQNE